MGHIAPLSRDQRRTLARLSRFLQERGLYLAGGVAVAVHRHHRRSLDLDFFSLHAPLDLAAARDALVQEGVPLEVVSLTDASLRLRIAETLDQQAVLSPFKVEEWRRLTPAERLQRAWALRGRLSDPRDVHDRKLFPAP